ncbi:class I SAM-dependent methyltransferase [Candidatus Poribacteria bacterium]|nr:class I SAM-dependent methyltransferase [Candidatus Poribacteria bacterium]
MSVFDEYGRYYDVYYAHKDYNAECDFIESAFARFNQSPNSILDLACGTGNHSLSLIKRGYEVIGVDCSPVMLEQCRAKAAKQEASISLHEADMRNFNLNVQFDAAICMFDAIDYLTDNADLTQFLRNVYSHVRPGGLFIFDFWHAVPLVRSYDPVRIREFRTETNRLLRISTTTLDITRQLANVEFHVLVFEGDHLVGEYVEVHPMRYFLPQEMAYIIESNGWKLRHLCPAFNLDAPIDADTWHLVAIASCKEGISF